MSENVINLRSITHNHDGAPLEFKSYDIQHTTIYEYSEPVEHSSHTFRLQPVEDPAQEVVRSEITISAEAEELVQFEDVFGNQPLFCTISKPYTRLAIECKSKIRLYDKLPDSRSPLVRKSSIPLIWMPWQRQMMSAYLLPPELPESQLQAQTEYAMSFVERSDYNLLETLKDINQRLYQDYEYSQGTTSLETTPFDVFVSRKGVCQD